MADTIVMTSRFRGPLLVIVVGAGGNGARLVPPLMQTLRPQDTVAIVDHDIVEDRNLVRQHFVARDIGASKAEVLARRYARDGIAIVPFMRQLGEGGGPDALALSNALTSRPSVTGGVIFGCVDNTLARKATLAMGAAIYGQLSLPWAYIDVGNESRGGQVLMSFSNWPMSVNGEETQAWRCNAFQAMPQMLTAEGSETPSCGERIDIQTVMVNHMAAGAALNCLSWLLLGIPFVQCGALFSTLNSMQPIPMASINARQRELVPDTKFAIS